MINNVKVIIICKVVAVASLPKKIAAGLQPKQNNSIRGLLLQSGWVVERLADDSCMVTYVVQVHHATTCLSKPLLISYFLVSFSFTFSLAKKYPLHHRQL